MAEVLIIVWYFMCALHTISIHICTHNITYILLFMFAIALCSLIRSFSNGVLSLGFHEKCRNPIFGRATYCVPVLLSHSQKSCPPPHWINMIVRRCQVHIVYFLVFSFCLLACLLMEWSACLLVDQVLAIVYELHIVFVHNLKMCNIVT